MNEIIKGEIDFEVMKKKYLEYVDIAERSVETYNTGIKQFALYLKENEITQPTRTDVLKFKNYLLETNHSVSTVNSYLIALRNFFKFLEYNGIYKNITENVKSIRDTELHKREALSVSQFTNLLELTKDIREKLLLSLVVSCGLRANEVANIQLEDIKRENDQYVVYVLGKGKQTKQDYVIIPDKVYKQIEEYVKEYNISDYLFVSTSNHNKGGKVTTRTLRRIVNNLYEKAGIKNDKIVFHSLRHTFATVSIKNGEDIREVSQALRHKHLNTTEIYLHDLEMKNNKCSNTVADLLI